ncbi:DUF4260 domain-containing protein [Marinilongibacter aquaticus]|uniref:DUF4260 domain-containing protein n=1 Tax=Marinilongibacter aquaticus TaxID=2975157 RepID=UPI0021BD68CB|nr:DUF4260 domain-containing protein [Marinilongibacter aquaticus]UBM57577.1 DUF4260 domain-containing protein [Marinilongibacter aquaticus]
MKGLIRLEEWVQFAFGICLFSLLPYAWWWFLVLILLPDIGMLGYLAGTKVGAWAYNLFHHKGLALLVLVMGYIAKQDAMALVGIILFAHSSMDRALGYGLKYEDDFKNTHLGHL